MRFVKNYLVDKCRRPDYQQKMAEGICEGIENFLYN